MAFEMIKQIHQKTSRENITTKSAAVESTEASALQARDIVIDFTRGQANATDSQNDPNNPYATSGTGNAYNISNEDLENAVNSQLKKARTVATIGAVGTIAGTLGTLLTGGQIGGVSQTGSFNIGDFFNRSGGNGSINLNGNNQYVQLGNTNTSTSLTTTIASIGATNKVESAIENYKKDATSANYNALATELAQARLDLQKTVTFKEAKKDELEGKNKEYQRLEKLQEQLETVNKEIRKKVDDKYEAIQAHKQFGLLEKENEAQNDIIKQSAETDIPNKDKEIESAVIEQSAIINSAKPDLNAMKEVEKTVTNSDGTTTTVKENVPDQEKRDAAQAKIDAANDEIKRLRKEFEDFKNAEEQKQKDAQAIIDANTAEMGKLAEIVKDGGGAQGINALLSENDENLNALNRNKDDREKVKGEITSIKQSISDADKYESQLKKFISKGEAALTKKPNIK